MKSSWLAYMLGGMTVLGIWTIASHKELLKDMKNTNLKIYITEEFND